MSTQPTLPKGIQRDDTEHGVTYYTADQVRQAVEAAAQRGVPAGEVVSAHLDYATVRWTEQTSSKGGGDPKNAYSWPIAGDLVYLSAAPPAPLQEAQRGVPDAEQAAIEPGTWAELKLMMEHSAFLGRLELSDALANIECFAKGAPPAPVQQGEAEPPAEREQRLKAALQAIKSSLMNQRRFGPDTLGGWRIAATNAEGDIEEVLAEIERLDRAANTKGAGHE